MKNIQIIELNFLTHKLNTNYIFNTIFHKMKILEYEEYSLSERV